jgi:hypothetical protein
MLFSAHDVILLKVPFNPFGPFLKFLRGQKIITGKIQSERPAPFRPVFVFRHQMNMQMGVEIAEGGVVDLVRLKGFPQRPGRPGQIPRPGGQFIGGQLKHFGFVILQGKDTAAFVLLIPDQEEYGSLQIGNLDGNIIGAGTITAVWVFHIRSLEQINATKLKVFTHINMFIANKKYPHCIDY